MLLKTHKTDFIYCFVPHLYRKLLIYNQYLHIPVICIFFFVSLNCAPQGRTSPGGGGEGGGFHMRGTRMLFGNFQLNHELRDTNLGLTRVLFDILNIRRDVHFKRGQLKET